MVRVMKTGRLIAILIAVTMMTAGAWAQDDDNNGPSAPPPNSNVNMQNGPNGPNGPSGPDGSTEGEDVTRDSNHSEAARVSYIHGDVSMQRGDSSGWSAVTVNTPLVPGDQIATGDKSRTEIQLDYAHILRLAAQSQAKMANLSRNQIQVQIAQGYANLTVLKGGEANIEIDSPNVAVHPVGPGRVRVQVNSDAETDVIVRSGEVEVTTPQGSTRVKEGQLITIRGTDNPEYKLVDAPSSDDWDRWNRDRDRTIETASSWHNTNQYYTGSGDLDAHGRWINVPGYGNVWQPNDQGPNWAPYQDGRWVWEPYWGWTWVSYEPWGWAPYHYGRWFYWNTAWVWWPGPIYPYYRPLWAPAFVTFFGFGGHVGFGFGFGTIGWCPVGPFDRFHPWYGRGFHNVNVVNINVINVHNGGVAPLGIRGRQPAFSNVNMAMTNARVRGGITTMSSADFARGGTGSRRFGVNEGQIRGAQVMTGNVGVVPTHESLQAGRQGMGGRSSIQPVSNNHFFTRNTPPSGPAAFHDQAAQMQHVVQGQGRGDEGMRMGGTSTGAHMPGATTSGTVNAGGMKTMGSNNGGANEGGRDSFHTFQGAQGSSSNGGNRTGNVEVLRGRGPESNGNNSGSNSGWTKFSQPSGGSSMDHNTGHGMTADSMGGRGNGSYKPPLEMNKPMVTPRDSGRNGSSSSYENGRNGSNSSYRPGPTYSAPSYSGPSQPRSYGGNSSYRPGPTYSAPSQPRNYGGSNSSGSYGGYNGGYNGGRNSGSYGVRSSYGGSSGGHSSGSYSSGSSGHSSGGHSSSSHSSGGSGHSSSHH
jgi:hypothetical protein